MLYVSTRDKTASYTAYRTLNEQHAPDGGQFLPFQWPVYSDEDIAELKELPFGQILARILNDFFGAKLTGWDLDLCAGKNPVRLRMIGHRLYVGELWHNPRHTFAHTERAIHRRLTGNDGTPTMWESVVIRIAVLFAYYPQLCLHGAQQFHAVATSGDPVSFLAPWYARKLGLPIGDIICCCEENNNIWDFFCYGQLNSAAACDPVLEQLLYTQLGTGAVKRYLAALEKPATYLLDEEQLQSVNGGVFPVVVGQTRISAMINSIYRTNGYILGSEGALAYGGLQDYRAHTGQTGFALMLTNRSPMLEADKVCALLSLDQNDMMKIINDFKE